MRDAFRRMLGIALTGIGVTACNVGNLAHAPADLRRSRPEPVITRIATPGPVEAALYRAAEREAQPRLIQDTADPAHDPKLRARACDAGDPDGCTRVASLLVHALDEPALGLSLWERACQVGVGVACERAADAYASAHAPPHDASRARTLYRRSCEATPPRPRGCRLAAKARVVTRHAALRGEGRPDLLFRFADRGCELGDRRACGWLAGLLDRGEAGLPRDAVLAAYYRDIQPFGRACTSAAPDALAVRRKRALRFGSGAWNLETLPGRKRQLLDDIALARLERAMDRVVRRDVDLRLRRLTIGASTEAEIPRLLAERRTYEHRSLETRPSCLACDGACVPPPPGSRRDAASEACLCACLADAGGCGMRTEVLARCASEPGSEEP